MFQFICASRGREYKDLNSRTGITVVSLRTHKAHVQHTDLQSQSLQNEYFIHPETCLSVWVYHLICADCAYFSEDSYRSRTTKKHTRVSPHSLSSLNNLTSSPPTDSFGRFNEESSGVPSESLGTDFSTPPFQ